MDDPNVTLTVRLWPFLSALGGIIGHQLSTADLDDEDIESIGEDIASAVRDALIVHQVPEGAANAIIG